MEALCMNIALVNESGYGQLGKWSRCLIFSFSSPLWIGWLWDIMPKLVLWSDSFFSLISTVSRRNQSLYSLLRAPLWEEVSIWVQCWGLLTVKSMGFLQWFDEILVLTFSKHNAQLFSRCDIMRAKTRKCRAVQLSHASHQWVTSVFPLWINNHFVC